MPPSGLNQDLITFTLAELVPWADASCLVLLSLEHRPTPHKKPRPYKNKEKKVPPRGGLNPDPALLLSYTPRKSVPSGILFQTLSFLLLFTKLLLHTHTSIHTHFFPLSLQGHQGVSFLYLISHLLF